MKNKINNLSIFHFLIFIGIGSFLTSCSATNLASEPAYGKSISSDYGDINADKAEEITQTERKIIYNASMRVEVKKLETQTKDVVEKAKIQGGYMVSADIDNVTIRIPAEKLNSFMDEIATYGKVESRNVYSQDVTEQYADLDIRLENAEKSRKRYLELLNKANEVADILAIERELERLNTNIERLKGQLNSYDTQVKYSSVSIYFDEKVKPGPLGYIFVGLYKGVKFLFVRG